jgi:hypothetical protein
MVKSILVEQQLAQPILDHVDVYADASPVLDHLTLLRVSQQCSAVGDMLTLPYCVDSPDEEPTLVPGQWYLLSVPRLPSSESSAS